MVPPRETTTTAQTVTAPEPAAGAVHKNDEVVLALLVTCVMPPGQLRCRRDFPSVPSATVPALAAEKRTGASPANTATSQPRNPGEPDMVMVYTEPGT